MSKARDHAGAKAPVLRRRKSRSALLQTSPDPGGERISDKALHADRSSNYSPPVIPGLADLSLMPAGSPAHNFFTADDTSRSPRVSVPPLLSSPGLHSHNPTHFVPGNTVFPLNASSYVDKNGIQVSVVIPLHSVPASAVSPRYNYGYPDFSERLVSEGVQTVEGRRRSSPGWNLGGTPRARHTPRAEGVRSPESQWQVTPTRPSLGPFGSVRSTPRNSRSRRSSQASSAGQRETTRSPRRRSRRSSVTFSSIEGITPVFAGEGGSPMQYAHSGVKSRRNTSSGRRTVKNSSQRRSVKGAEASPDGSSIAFLHTSYNASPQKRRSTARGSKRLSLRSVAPEADPSASHPSPPAETLELPQNSAAEDFPSSEHSGRSRAGAETHHGNTSLLPRDPPVDSGSSPPLRLSEARPEDPSENEGVPGIRNLVSLLSGTSHGSEEKFVQQERNAGAVESQEGSAEDVPIQLSKVSPRDNSLGRAVEQHHAGDAVTRNPSLLQSAGQETPLRRTASDVLAGMIDGRSEARSERGGTRSGGSLFPWARRAEEKQRRRCWWDVAHTGWEALCCWRTRTNRTPRTSGDRRNIRAIRGLFLLILVLGHMTADRSSTVRRQDLI